MESKAKADVLLALHHAGSPLILPNIWNPIGARILQKQGYPAVATGSAAVAAMFGFEDGERLQRSTLVEFLGRIARSVDIPLTADIESGYGTSLSELVETINLILDAGVVGVNLEDSVGDGEEMRSVEVQCERLRVARDAADRRGIHLVINARTDCFMSSSFGSKAEALEEVVRRAAAYAEAGADCIYPIGPGDEPTIRSLRERIEAPLNILGGPKSTSVASMRAIGINRISVGPYLFRSCLRCFVDVAAELRDSEDLGSLASAMKGSEVGVFLQAGPESA